MARGYRPPDASSLVSLIGPPDPGRFTDPRGVPVPESHLQGAAALADSNLGGEAVLGQAMNYPAGFEFVYDDYWAGPAQDSTPEDFYSRQAGDWLYEEGWDDPGGPRGYTYQNLGAQVSSTVSRAPADITLAPTSSTNPQRPRTVGAGYDSSRKCLTVVFRDGTFYNYYEVGGLEWGNFKRARSKGRFIKKYLDGKMRGTADMGAVPLEHQEVLYRAARTAQAIEGGYQYNQKRGSKRGTGIGRYSYGSQNTTSRAARKRYAAAERAVNS